MKPPGKKYHSLFRLQLRRIRRAGRSRAVPPRGTPPFIARSRGIRLLALGTFLAATTSARADADLEYLLSLSLEEVMATKVTISTSVAQSRTQAPSVVSVITAEDIKATGATNLTEALQTVPSLYIKPNLFGFRPLLSFRGAAGTHTLLMVNGAPVKDLIWSSGIYWKGLPADMIEKIEVIRGPGSALFGSDASSGVVNVITKTAGRMDRSEAGMRVGSFDSQSAWWQHGGKWNDMDFAVAAEFSRTDGHKPHIGWDGQSTQDARAGVNTHISYAPGPAGYGWQGADIRFSLAQGNWRLLGDYARHDNVEIGLTGGGVLDPATRGSDSRLDLQLQYANAAFAQDWGVNAEVRYRNLEYDSGDGFMERPPGFVCTAASNCAGAAVGTYPNGLINRQRSAERDWNVEGRGHYTGIRNHGIIVGSGYGWQDLHHVSHIVNYGTGPTGAALPAGGPLVDLSGSAYAFAPEKTRTIGYAFVQDIWKLAQNWELTAGARIDHYSDFGSAVTPRLGLVWQSAPALTTKLMYGEAFRAPSYLELYSLTAATLPNPGLAPEKSRTWDLAFSWLATRDLSLGLTLYRFTQTDLIAQDSSLKYQNMGKNIASGYELEAQWQVTRTWRLAGNLSDRNDTTPYNSTPRQTGYLRSDWLFAPAWHWNLQANLVGPHAVAPGDPRAAIHAYALVDTTIRHTPHRDWEIAASIRNLFNVDARELSSKSLPENLPLPRRSLFAEMRYKF